MNNNKFNHIKFYHSDKDRIVNAVIKKLGLKNKFELNDRMEGVMFLDKHIRRVFSSIVVEKEYNICLTSKEKPLLCTEEFIYNGLKHKIVFPYSNGLIKINRDDFEILIVVVIDDSYSNGYIHKTIKKELIKNKIGKTITVKLDSL